MIRRALAMLLCLLASGTAAAHTKSETHTIWQLVGRTVHLTFTMPIVEATTMHDDPDVLAKVSRGLGEPMVGIEIPTLPADQRYADRGW